MSQTPQIVFSPLGRRWYVVTRYREKRTVDGKPYLIASTKHDVTMQMQRILREHRTDTR